MDSLTRSLIKPFLPESIDGKEVTAVFGGGFKPPTAGHLSVIQKALQDHPEIDNVVIYVGGKVRDGITQDQSFKIWDEHYKTLIDRPVRIEKSVAPIKDIYRYAKDNPEDITYFLLGARQDREDDLQDIVNRSKSINKYPNLQLKTISTPDGGMSGTNARNALMSNDKEAFKFFVPSNIDYNEVWNILTSQPINEGDPKVGTGKKPKDPFGLNMFAYELMREEESYDTFDYPKHIKSLTTFMLDKGMKLKPLPTVKFINDDVENAENFFGKTAYYDPNNHRIVLYTLNRHPKDVMRSFAHEMIHHMQNHEGKLETIHTQNTNEEGDLPEIEREAYEKGNMTFRSWTDTITEGVLKENTDEDFRSYKSIFAPGITITVVFKEYEKYNELEPLFKEYGYGFYSPKTKTIIIDGEVFINSDLTFNDLKFVEAHEISHLIMNHSAPRSDKDELEADLGAYILLKSQNLPVDNVKKQFKFRHGIEFDESLLDQVKDKF